MTSSSPPARSILVLAPFLTRQQAGASHATINIVNALHRRGQVKVTVVAAEIEHGLLDSTVGVVPIVLPEPWRGFWRLGRTTLVPRFARALRRLALPRTDLAYTQSLELGLAFRRLDSTTPIASHLGHVLASREAMEESSLPHPWRALDITFAERRERRSYRDPNWTHVVSTRLVAETRARHFQLPVSLFRVQPLGIDTARFSDRSARAATRRRLGLAEDVCLIVSVARMVEWKNLDWLVRAVGALPGHCHLLLVGDGPERDNLVRLVPADSRSYVHFVGHCDPVPYLAAADVFALPSAIESFGMAYAEAMCMSLPCVGLRYEPPVHLSSAQDVIEHGQTGYVVSNQRELETILRRLAEDSSLRGELGVAARRRASSLFSVDAYATFLEESMNIPGNARHGSPHRARHDMGA